MSIKFTFGIIAEEQRTCDKHKQEYTSRMFMRSDGGEYWNGCPICNEEEQREKRRQEQLQEQIAYKQRQIARLYQIHNLI